MVTDTLVALAFVGMLGISVLVVHRLEAPTVPWMDRLRSRFVLGVPWGSAIVIVLVLLFYLVGQDGLTNFDDPVSIPFRAWSYFYPLGMVTSSFAHNSGGHVTGNLLSAAVVAPIAEYAWGHYTLERDADGIWSRPWVRAVVIFPLAVLVTGLVISVVELGPVIGFSVLVYAFAGFAIVRYPLATLIATIGGQGAVSIAYRALEYPISVYTVSAGAPTPPSWAQIAIQGHAIGFLAGLFIALVVFSRRGWRPSPTRLWVAVVLFGASKSLWAIYWYGESGSYILYRGPGVVAVVLFALVITAAVTARDRPMGSDIGMETAGDDPTPPLGSLLGSIRTVLPTGATARNIAISLLLLVALALSVPAIPVNLFVPDGEVATDGDTLVVDGYTVQYAEGVENELVSFVNLSALGFDTSTQASGVIVSSETRHIWWEERSAQQLSHSGSERIHVGGLGYRETVAAERTGWRPVGNGSVYQVWLSHGDERVLAHESPARQANAVLRGATLSILTTNGTFQVTLERADGQNQTVDLPAAGEAVRVGAVTLEREEETLYGVANDTRIRLASRT